jgi:rubrerythrin
MDDALDPMERLLVEELSGLMEAPAGETPGDGEIVCPRCGSTVEPVPVLYGDPTPEAFADADAGRIRLGGCLMEPEAPDYRCPICDAALPMVAAWRRP